jgi:hypothetical protein
VHTSARSTDVRAPEHGAYTQHKKCDISAVTSTLIGLRRIHRSQVPENGQYARTTTTSPAALHPPRIRLCAHPSALAFCGIHARTDGGCERRSKATSPGPSHAETLTPTSRRTQRVHLPLAGPPCVRRIATHQPQWDPAPAPTQTHTCLVAPNKSVVSSLTCARKTNM